MYRYTPVVLGILIASFLVSCELPEGPPDVDIETILRAPILAEKTFVLLGPQDGVDALIDTTRGGLDTLFQADADHVLSVVAEASLSDIVDADNITRNITDRITPEPTPIRASASDIMQQDIHTGYNVEVGAMEVGAQDLGETTLTVGSIRLDPVAADQNVPIGTFTHALDATIRVPATDIIPGIQHGTPLPAVTQQEITFTQQIDILLQTNLYLVALELTGGTLNLNLTNQLGWDLTVSRIELQNPDQQTLGVSTAIQALPQGGSATFAIPLQPGSLFHRSLTIRLTVSWDAQTASDPQDLSIAITGEVSGNSLTFEVRDGNAPLRVDAPSPLTISDRFVTATFVSTTDPGLNRLYLDITNNFPFPLEDGTGQGAQLRIFSDGRQINTGNDRFAAPIPPGATARLELDLSGQTLRNQLTYELLMALPPSATPYTLQSTHGIHVQAISTPLEIKQARADVQPLQLDLGSNLIDLSDVVEVAELTEDTGDVNQLIVTLTNNLAFQLTDGTLDPAAPPRIFVRRPGEPEPIIELVFDRSPQPGETTTARASLAGKRITSQLEYELDIGTPGGQGVVFNQSDQVRVHITTTPLRFYYARAVIPAQENISIHRENIEIRAESQFAGALIASAELQLSIANSLPIPLTVDRLVVRNRDAVGSFPAGFPVLELTDITLPPQQTTSLTVQLERVPLSARVDADILARSPGSNGAFVDIAATDTLGIQATGSVTLEELYFYPQGETFHTRGSLTWNMDDVTFLADDFVELNQGDLVLENVVNTLDVALDTVQVSFSGIRKPPFGSGDSLVISFIRGASNQPEHYIFAGIPSQASGLVYQIALSGLRIYPENNTLRYFIRGRVEHSNTLRTLRRTDSLKATAVIRNIDFREVRATTQQLVTSITPDRNGDDYLDLATEAEQVSIEGLAELSQRVRNLRITGTVFSLSLTTNVVGNVILYLALQGTREDGSSLFLEGQGAFAVPPGDSVVEKMLYEGTPLPPEHIIRLQFAGAPSPDQPVTRTFVFTPDNSNIDDFLSLLPSEIRAIGRAAMDGPVQLRRPLELDASAGLTIPLHITSPALDIQDTLDINFQDIADLPTDPEDDVQIKEAQLQIFYENGIPLKGTVQLDILDEQGQPVGIRLPTEEPLTIASAPVDQQGFATGFQPGEQTITLTREAINRLKQGKKARMRLVLYTPSPGQEAYLRASDAIRIRLQARFHIILHVNP